MHNDIRTTSVSLPYAILLALLTILLGSCALNNKLDYYKIGYLRYKTFSDDNPIHSIVALKKMETKIADKNKTWLYDSIANAFAMVGEYSKSLEYMDRGYPTYQSVTDSKIIEDYRPQDAIKFIESMADSNQVVFINEAHNVAIHRAFSIRLLKILYDKGFRYFAAETLKPDTDLNNRGYPLIKVTGEYTNEPVYGDLLRIALKLGKVMRSHVIWLCLKIEFYQGKGKSRFMGVKPVLIRKRENGTYYL